MNIDIEKLKVEMARNCMNQKILAEKTGLSTAVISSYFVKGYAPSTNVGRIAKALCVDVTAIIPEFEYKEREK